MMLPGFKTSTTIRTEILDAAVRLVFSELESRYKLAPLTELASISGGGTPLRGNSVFYGGDIPWAKIGDLTEAGKWISSTEETITEEALQNSSAKLFPSGTVLYSMYGSIGKAAITTKQLSTNQAILGLVPKNDINPEYLYYCLINARLALFSDAKGTSQKNINAKMVKGFTVPIPPNEIINSVVDFLSAIEDGEDISKLTDLPQFISVQRRIVARIEELAAKIEEAQKLRRQAGEEAEALFAAATRSLFDSKSSSMVTIEELVGKKNLKNGLSIRATDEDSPTRCLRLSALRDGKIDCADSKPIPLNEKEAAPYLIEDKDVFVVRGNGSKRLVGRAGMVEENIPGTIFPDLFIRVPLDKNQIIPEFFVAWWNSQKMRDLIEETAKTTSGIWKINQGHIASFSIPILSLPEQRCIVAHLDELQAKIDALKKLQARTGEELDALLPSVLDRAFRGEL